MTLPEGLTAIEERAFYGCGSLTNVSFPKTVSFIASDAFDGTPWLKTQTGDFAAVNGYAFKNNRCGASEAVIPDDITAIGDYLFDHCETLVSVKLPETLTDIGRFAFFGFKKLRGINIPKGIKYIGYFAFGCCDSLGKLNIPDGVQEDTSWYYQTKG